MFQFMKLLEKQELLAAAVRVDWSDVVVCEDSDHFTQRIPYALLTHDHIVQCHCSPVGIHDSDC
jgi:hypothetical protein